MCVLNKIYLNYIIQLIKNIFRNTIFYHLNYISHQKEYIMNNKFYFNNIFFNNHILNLMDYIINFDTLILI